MGNERNLRQGIYSVFKMNETSGKVNTQYLR